MFVRQVKRKCNIRGCKNSDCFAISRTREMGNTVILCKACLIEGLEATADIDPKTKSNVPALENTVAPSLFFNEKALARSDKTDKTEEAVAEAGRNDEGFTCRRCGKVFESERGLQAHLRFCSAQSNEE